MPSICDDLQLCCSLFSSSLLSLVWNSWGTRKRRPIARKERLFQFRMVIYIHVCLVSSMNPTQDSPETEKRPNSNITFDETRGPLEPWITAGPEGWPGVWEIGWQWQRTPRQDVFFCLTQSYPKCLASIERKSCDSWDTGPRSPSMGCFGKPSSLMFPSWPRTGSRGSY